MKTSSTFVHAGVLAICLVTGVFSASSRPAAPYPPAPGVSSTHVFQFRLVGSQVVPPVNSDGFGSCTVTLDDVTGDYTVAGNYTCLRGSVTDVHFHAPAGVGQEAPVIVGFANTGGSSGTFSKSGTLSPQNVAHLLNGQAYVQLHSLFRVSGELRGQVTTCATASITTRNGSGINPLALASASPPILNAPWSVDIDCTGHAPSVAYLFFYARPSAGTIVGAGEILVRSSAKQLFITRLPHAGDVVTYHTMLSGNTALCGLESFAQAYILGSPGGKLTNALDLVFGQ